MKFSLLVFITMLITTEVAAQQEFFVFIHQPQGQPFYVRMKEDSYSSSATGHLILSSLRDSVYNMYVGFPRNRDGEQLFVVPVSKKDRGFELQRAGNQWILRDLQTSQQIVTQGTALNTDVERRTDTYSELMAGLVDDSSVLYTQRDTTAEQAVAVVDSAARAGKKVSGGANTQAQPDSTSAKKKGKGKGKGKKPAAAHVPADSVVTKDTPAVQTMADTVANTIPKTVTDTAENTAPKTDSIVATDSTNRLEGGAVRNPPAAAKDSTAVADSTRRDAPLRDPRDIIRYSTENVEEGKLIIYLDRTGPVTDTIRIIVPR